MFAIASGVAFYERAKRCVLARGFADEIAWAERLRLAEISEQVFLAEVLFVALNSGMRAAVVRAKWPAVSAAFGFFGSARAIVDNAETYVAAASAHFASVPKLRSVVVAARRIVDAGGWATFRVGLLADPALAISGLPFIGPVTRWHLLRNLGADVAKPDRHLVRLAERLGAADASSLCATLAAKTGDRVGVVDLVLWRHAEQQCVRCDAEPAEVR